MTNQAEGYWDQIADQWRRTNPQRLWRTHSDAVNTALLADWLPLAPDAVVLKTDLFDEACTEGLYPLLSQRAGRVVGADISHLTAQIAGRRFPYLLAAGADVRRLPFPDEMFETIVSTSTLDHFDSRHHIVDGLIELRRVLVPGGALLLTLDNLANPIIALRNVLPYKLLNKVGVLPYTVGATFGPLALERVLQGAGFQVRRSTAILHCPRVLAVALAGVLEKRTNPKTQKRFLRILMAFERMSAWPTKYLTGHFIAVYAVKPEAKHADSS